MTQTTQRVTDGADDVVEVLLDQHRRIRIGMSAVLIATGEERKRRFDEVRALLVVHEAAEEMVLRPVTRDVVGNDLADARNDEERRAAEALAALEGMDVNEAGFDAAFIEFQREVIRHARNEESLELPRIREAKDSRERAALGRTVVQVERVAPTHPHPSTAGSTLATWVVGPFASLLDRARDAVSGIGDDEDDSGSGSPS